jgi:hypothetical protein
LRKKKVQLERSCDYVLNYCLPLELKKEIESFDGKIENPRENNVT